MTSRHDLQARLETIYVLLEDSTRRALAPTGLTPTQFGLLDVLADAPREGLSITTLASQLLCTRGNVSRLVGRLQAAGLVSTGSVSSDERLVLARLTRQGRLRLDDARAALEAADATRFGDLDPADLRRVTDDLQVLEDGLRAWLTKS